MFFLLDLLSVDFAASETVKVICTPFLLPESYKCAVVVINYNETKTVNMFISLGFQEDRVLHKLTLDMTALFFL